MIQAKPYFYRNSDKALSGFLKTLVLTQLLSPHVISQKMEY